jgi:methylmalonyl-CoA decarboxylase
LTHPPLDPPGADQRADDAATGHANAEDDMPLIEIQRQDPLAILTMNDDARRNAFSAELCRDLQAAFETLAAAEVRAVVLRAPRGAKVWSSGVFVDELPAEGPDPYGGGEDLHRVVRTIREFPAPVVALIEGGVWGGACEVAFACDLRIAVASATFAVTPAKLGLVYNISGILALLRSVPVAVARELLYTAQPIDAGRAWLLGMVNHVKTAEEIEGFTLGVAAQIALSAPLSVTAAKEELRLLEDAVVIPSAITARMLELRRQVYGSHDSREGLAAFRDKRPPEWQGR